MIGGAGGMEIAANDATRSDRLDEFEGCERRGSSGAGVGSRGFHFGKEEGGKCLALYFWSTASSSYSKSV